MQFRIADTFTDSLTRLTADEQKAVKRTAFDLQVDPSRPSLRFHKLDRARDKRFWSMRVSRDIRLIVHKSDDCLLLCYVDHHDKAYAWAERRKLETHPKTGAAQLVEIRETVKEVVVPVYVEEEQAPVSAPPIFDHVSTEDLLAYGVPEEWLNDVQKADETSLLALTDHLPSEASEALLELATGGRPTLPTSATSDPFEHPDAKRRFRVMTNVEELERALEFPWEKWTVFLHPEQQDWVQRSFNGPARVSGSAGTGKTIVALHRAVHLARRDQDARVLLATFSEPLARALQIKLRRLIGNEPRLAERIDVRAMDALGVRLHAAVIGPAKIASADQMRSVLEAASAAEEGHGFTPTFLAAEWDQVVDAWQLKDWESYRDVARLGRKTRLPQARREVLWKVFERVWADLEAKSLLTMSGVFAALAEAFDRGARSPYDHAVIDESQDVSVSQLRFLGALAGSEPDGLFFAGDLGQRIFQAPFSWRSLGVEVRGRARTLRVNYRTSHQIRRQADRLLGPETVDVDGNVEVREGTVSVFNGPPPKVQTFDSEIGESEAVGNWISQRLAEGVPPQAVGVIVRADEQMPRARAAIAAAGANHKVLDEDSSPQSGCITACTMHLAKGLEFSAVAVMACDDEVLPLQSRIDALGDSADLEETYETERHLLYVAATRARDHLFLSGVAPASEFLDDLG